MRIKILSLVFVSLHTLASAQLPITSLIGEPGPMFLHVNDAIVFTAPYNAPGDREFWVTDGTSEGTVPFDLYPGATGSWPYLPMRIQNKIYFFAGPETGKYKVYSSDGTAAGTKLAANFTTTDWMMRVVEKEGDLFVFAGKTGGTQALYSLNPDTGAMDEIHDFDANEFQVAFRITDATVMNGTIYFALSGEGTDLWKTDGTTDGTVKVADFVAAGNLKVASDVLYFTEQPVFGGKKTELYKSDGTTEGTLLVKEITGSTSNPADFFVFNNKLVFTTSHEDSGTEVWISDGTENNTILLRDIHEGSGSGIAFPMFTVLDNTLFFAATSPASGTELWKTDGTSNGTVVVKDIVPGSGNANPKSLSASGGKVYFSAFTPETGNEIWVTDGTETNTELFLDVLPGPTDSNPQGMIMLDGNNLVFMADTQSAGRQVYSSEETVTSISREEHTSVRIYPNPSPGILKIDSNGIAGKSLAIFNTQGICVASATELSENAEIDLSHLPPGLYVMKIAMDREVVAMKVVKR